jgi:PAS domain S-box-containing protein
MKDEQKSREQLLGELLELRAGMERQKAHQFEQAATLESAEEAAARYRRLVEISRDGMAVYREGRIVEANGAMAKIVGMQAPEKLVGQYVWDIFHPECRDAVRERFESPSAPTGTITGLKINRPDRSVAEVELIRTEGFHGGRRTGSIILTDVTRRKRLESALRRSEERYRTSIQSLNEGFAVLNEEGIVTYANNKLAEMTGYAKEEIVGRSATTLMDEANSEIFASEFFLRRKTETQGYYELALTHKSGQRVPVIVSDNAVFDGDGSFKGSLTTVTDISDLKRFDPVQKASQEELELLTAEKTAELSREIDRLTKRLQEQEQVEEELRQGEERFRAIFEAATDSIYIKDPSLRFTHVNPAFANLLGRQASEIVGCTSEDVFGEEAGKHIREVDIRVFHGETVDEEHARLVNGTRLTFHDIRVPLRDGCGEIIGLCGISRNVTERKRARPVARMVGREYRSEKMRATLAKARFAAPTDGIVLLLGESGSGKDFLARWIHDHSKRSNGPFFAINCAAVPHELAESELFGHEPGAFTGARGRKRGLLELAEGGTLLLNEIGELSLSLQSKLLSFLDSRSFLRVGGEKSISVNARLIAATHRDLEAEVAGGRFWQALWYRLNVFCIEVPPLRERSEDIPILVEEIMARLAAEMHLTEIPVIDSVAMESLSQYHWPGNVRELRNVLERALMLSEESRLDVSLPLLAHGTEEWSHKVVFPEGRGLHDVTDRLIRSLCLEALRRCRGNRKEAAEMLQVSRTAFYRYMKRLEISGEIETQ